VPYSGANDPSRVDWVDYADRVTQSDPATFLRTALAGMEDRAIWLVYDEGYVTVGSDCATMATELAVNRSKRVAVAAEHAYLIRFAPAR